LEPIFLNKNILEIRKPKEIRIPKSELRSAVGPFYVLGSGLSTVAVRSGPLCRWMHCQSLRRRLAELQEGLCRDSLAKCSHLEYRAEWRVSSIVAAVVFTDLMTKSHHFPWNLESDLAHPIADGSFRLLNTAEAGRAQRISDLTKDFCCSLMKVQALRRLASYPSDHSSREIPACRSKRVRKPTPMSP
jgi:hypothetical protein